MVKIINGSDRMDNKKIINIINISLAVILSIAVFFTPEPEYLKEEIVDNSIEEIIEEKKPNKYYSIALNLEKGLSTSDNMYPQKELITYQEEKHFEIEKKTSTGENIKYGFEINNDNILNIIDKVNNTSYAFNKITNIKSVIAYSEQTYDSISIIILTNEGKIYYRKSKLYGSNINYETIEEEFILLDSTYIFEKIGYINSNNQQEKEIGALTSNQEEVTIYLENNQISEPLNKDLYSCLADCSLNDLKINYTGTAYYYAKNLTYRNEEIKVSYAFLTEENKVYIIDNNGILYSNNKGNSNVIKYSENKVTRISFGEINNQVYVNIELYGEPVQTYLKVTKVFGIEEEQLLHEDIRNIVNKIR